MSNDLFRKDCIIFISLFDFSLKKNQIHSNCQISNKITNHHKFLTFILYSSSSLAPPLFMPTLAFLGAALRNPWKIKWNLILYFWKTIESQIYIIIEVEGTPRLIKSALAKAGNAIQHITSELGEIPFLDYSSHNWDSSVVQVYGCGARGWEFDSSTVPP